MNKPPEKSSYGRLRAGIQVAEYVVILLGIISAVVAPASAAASIAGILVFLVAGGVARAILDMADRTALQTTANLDVIGALESIKRALQDIREVQVLQSKNPQEVFRHAKSQYGGAGFPEGEAIIALNAQTAFDYAADILGRPFPAGEAAIAKNGALAYEYARRVLGGPFPAGEPAIYRDQKMRASYEALVRACTVPQPPKSTGG